MNYGHNYCGYNNQNKEWRTGIIMTVVHSKYPSIFSIDTIVIAKDNELLDELKSL